MPPFGKEMSADYTTVGDPLAPTTGNFAAAKEVAVHLAAVADVVAVAVAVGAVVVVMDPETVVREAADFVAWETAAQTVAALVEAWETAAQTVAALVEA